MWTVLGGVAILGYFGFVIKNLYQVTSPPLCGQNSHCAYSVLSKNTPYLTQVYISNFPAKNFYYEIDKKFNVTLLVPSLPSKRDQRTEYDDDEEEDEDEITDDPVVERLGSVITSMDSVHNCDAVKIIPTSDYDEKQASPTISVVKQKLSFIRKHLLHRNKDDCMVLFNAKLENPIWHSNRTRVYLSVSTTAVGTNSQAILRPVSQLLSTMYFPDKKKRLKRRYLLNPNKQVTDQELNPPFQGRPYMAVPKRTKIGPIAIDSPLSMSELQRTYRKHWITGKNEYAPAIYVNTLVSPRDEYQPLPIDRSKTKFNASQENYPSIQIEMDAFAWRKYSIETLMLHSISQMESSFGTSQYDSDSLKLLLAGESPLILLVTLCVSVLHMLFEYLALSSNWSYFQAATKDAAMSEKVSRRAILLDLIFEILILTWLWDDGEAKIVQIVLGCRVIFNLWRYNKLRAVHAANTQSAVTEVKKTKKGSKRPPVELTVWRALSLTQLREMRDMFTVDEFESQSIKSLSLLLVPILMGMGLYQLVFVPQKGWLSWLIKTGALASYVGGFVAMTPQLYKNFYFKSVEHLPWTTLTYQFLNTIIDDLFSFLIRMPNAHRLSVFRDDIVFVVYWIQKRHYRHSNANKLDAKKNE